MTNDEGATKRFAAMILLSHSSFVLRHSLDIRHLAFGILPVKRVASDAANGRPA